LISFAYSEQQTANGTTVYQPIISASFCADGRLVGRGVALLDTGADRTHLPLEVLDVAGVSLTQCKTLNMEWGPSWKTNVYAPPGQWTVMIGDCVVPIRPVVGEDFGSVVLGRDCLESFRATFDGPARRLFLEPHEIPPANPASDRQRGADAQQP
jgi:hypothetical protein